MSSSNNTEDFLGGGAEHLASLLNRAEQLKYVYYCNGIDNAVKVTNKKIRAEAKLVRSRAQWLHGLSNKSGEVAALSFKPWRKKSLAGSSGLPNDSNAHDAEQSTFITWMNHREYSMGSLASQSDVISEQNSKKAKRHKDTKHRKVNKKKEKVQCEERVIELPRNSDSRERQVQFSDDRIKTEKPLQIGSDQKNHDKIQGSLDQFPRSEIKKIADQVKEVHQKIEKSRPENSGEAAQQAAINDDFSGDALPQVFLTEALPDIFENQSVHPASAPTQEEPVGERSDFLTQSMSSIKLPAIVTQSVLTTHAHPASRIPITPPSRKDNTKTQQERIDEFLCEQQQFNKEFTNYYPNELADDIFRSDLYLQLMDFSSKRCLPKRKLKMNKYTVYALKKLGIHYPEWN